MKEITKVAPQYPVYKVILEIISGVAIVVSIGLLLKYYSILPDIIPIHFNDLGTADGYGSKNFIFILPGMSLIIYFFPDILIKFNNVYKYFRNTTKENPKYNHKYVNQLITLLKTEFIICIAYIEWISIGIALNKSEGMVRWFLPVFLAVVFGTLAVYIRKLLKIN
ncbi:DUF1648 domain-containing protein [Clostridium tyrobutyricum]|uniref:DUF1648 domain-containing protein n=1 Tax=Clostridium tyrobutyricum TaxID=1519 RepID=UPI0010C5830B|nr:DUF1648 domain-containing protein [Clostridium tyrobutyricum]QCH26487.1 hypothetical protein EZN00_00076 [Clostridium tyrobutyricum]